MGILKVIGGALLLSLTFAPAPGRAQSVERMLAECASVAQTYFRDWEARTEMRYNGQRVDGTHAINGRIFLETRYEDFACSYRRGGRRMVEFFAEGQVRNAYLPGQTAPDGADIVQVTGVPANDVLNVRSGPGTGYQIVGALSNGTSVRKLVCQAQGDSRWCQIEMMTDMRERGWVNARYLAEPDGQTTQLPGAGRMERVRFDPGTTGTEFTDQLGPGMSVTYLLNARKGQTLYFRLAARGRNMSWRIFNPDGSLLDAASSAQEYRGQLWQSGDHKIEVVNQGNRARTFNVIFGIR